MPATKFGIDGGIASGVLTPVVKTIGLATETDAARPVQDYDLSQITRMGIDGGIAPFEPDFGGKSQVLQQASEADTAISVINPNDVILGIGQGLESDSARPVIFGQPATIALVSSIRGTNIIAADTQLTVNVNQSAGVTSITVNGVAASLVTIVTPTEITCQVPLGVGAQYFTSVNVIATNGFGPSAPFSASWQPPQGMVETDFTVDYAGLDPDSPFAGDPAFSDLAIGDSCIYDAVTTPDGLGVSMDGAGEFTITGTITQVQTFDYYIYDLSDNTVSATIEQITVQPGPVEVLIGQAAETDSTFAVSSLDVITATIGRAQESDSAFAVVDGSPIFQFIGQAAETDTSQPVSAQGPVQNVAIGLTTESDSVFPVADDSIPIGIIQQISEVGFAFPVTNVGAVSQVVGIAAEDNTARDVNFPATLNSIRNQLVALQVTVNAQQLLILDLYQRFDLNVPLPNTYADDGSSISNARFDLTKTDNGDGTFTITRFNNSATE